MDEIDPIKDSHIRTCRCAREFNAVHYDKEGAYVVKICADCHGGVNEFGYLNRPYTRSDR